MPDRKVAAIRAFMADLIEYRQAVKDDAKKMLSKVTLPILADRQALEEFLIEMITALADKHLVANGKVRPQAARMIKRYTAGMVPR
jgi:hypothetical protein